MENNNPAYEFTGFVALWGSPEHKDLLGEYFTPQTNFGFRDAQQVPVTDRFIGAGDAVGTATWKLEEGGISVQGQLSDDEARTRALFDLLKQGRLYAVIGTEVIHGVEIDADGRVLRWPLTEVALTVTPADSDLPPLKAKKENS